MCGINLKFHYVYMRLLTNKHPLVSGLILKLSYIRMEKNLYFDQIEHRTQIVFIKHLVLQNNCCPIKFNISAIHLKIYQFADSMKFNGKTKAKSFIHSIERPSHIYTPSCQYAIAWFQTHSHPKREKKSTT